MRAEEIRRIFFTRHMSTTNLLQFFADEHLHPELKRIVEPIRELAFTMVNILPDGSELLTGLRRLIDAKDAFIRQYLAAINFKLPQQRAVPYVAPVTLQKPNNR